MRNMDGIGNENNGQKYSEELIKMAHRDQQMRRDHQNPNNKNKISNEEFQRVDRENTERLKKIVKEIGWPTWSKVGKKASYGAWILIQHADDDVTFQEECLKLLEEAYTIQDIYPENLAYLTDRVAVNKGEEQIYGTQFRQNETGELIPCPIEDQKNIDERRKKMNLEPFEIYTQKMQGKYQYPVGYQNAKVGDFDKVT